jgi:transposase-like protein
MTSKKRNVVKPLVATLPAGASEWLEQIVTGPMSAESVEEVMRGFKKVLIERVLGAEMSHHLGYSAGEAKPEMASNLRNGRSSKTVLTQDGPLRLDIPRDRAGSFEPLLIGKHERRFTGFDDKILAMYARVSLTGVMEPPMIGVLEPVCRGKNERIRGLRSGGFYLFWRC